MLENTKLEFIKGLVITRKGAWEISRRRSGATVIISASAPLCVPCGLTYPHHVPIGVTAKSAGNHKDAVKEVQQEDNRFRFWAKVPEFEDKYLRVVTLEDKLTIHNAFLDRRFRP